MSQKDPEKHSIFSPISTKTPQGFTLKKQELNTSKLSNCWRQLISLDFQWIEINECRIQLTL